MRKIWMAAAAATAMLPVAAVAQSAKEVRHDERVVAKDKRKVGEDVARGNFKKAGKQTQHLAKDQRELAEDWQDYRRSHRDVFRRPAYVAPRGMRYRTVVVGAQLSPMFYGRSYWLNDFGRYRLPRPGIGQEYVRYGNDVLLVDIHTGRVIRVYSAFFL